MEVRNYPGLNLVLEFLAKWYYIGTNLLKRFNDSVIKAVIDAFPEHNWEEWRFERVPLRWWNNRKHIRKYLDWLFQELKLKSMDDWYYVTNEQLISNYGTMTNLRITLTAFLSNIFIVLRLSASKKIQICEIQNITGRIQRS